MAGSKEKMDWNKRRVDVERELSKMKQIQQQKHHSELVHPSFRKQQHLHHQLISHHQRGYSRSIIAVVVCLVFVILLSLWGEYHLTGLAAFNYTSTSEFSAGTYNQTFRNATQNATQLNATDFKAGTFTSEIFDGGAGATWDNMSFVMSSQGPAADNGVNEATFGSGNINMKDCVLMYHLNNDTKVGETATVINNYCPNGWNGSGSGFNGTWTGSNGVNAASVNQVMGLAANMDGSSDYIKTDKTFDGSNLAVGALSIWLYRTADTGAIERVFGTDDEWELVVRSASPDAYSCQFYRAAAVDGTGEPTASTNTWFHIVCNWDDANTNSTIFTNGYKSASHTDTDGTNPTAATIFVGDAANDGIQRGQTFPGRIDEVILFNRTLTDAEVLALYERGVRRLNLSVRSCDDAACSGETFTDVGNVTDWTPLSVSSNRYFQFEWGFNATTSSVAPFLYNLSVGYTPGSSDLTNPNVTNVLPSADSRYNQSEVFEIGGNVTDETAVSIVLANVTYPNATVILYTLSNRTGLDHRYNISFNTTMGGRYTVLFIANDTSNNINNSVSTPFDINGNLTFINGAGFGYLGGTRRDMFYNGSIGVLQLNQTTINGSFLSQIFDASSSVTWNNISWISSAGELPSNQVSDTTINMTGNVLLMHFNNDSAYGESSAYVYDYSGNQNNGTGVNFESDEVNSSGKIGKAFNFDGTNDYVAVRDSASLDLTNGLTLSVWIKETGFTAWAGFVGKDAAATCVSPYMVYSLSFTDDGTGYRSIRYLTAHGGVLTGSTGTDVLPNDNAWHHLVGTFDGTTKRLYIDTVEKTITSATPGSAIDTNNLNFTVGKDASPCTAFFNGMIDEVAVWNRSISADEVTALYSRGVTRLNLTVQTCDDTACSGESFTDINETTPYQLSLTNNQYFQYNASFETINSSYNPQLYNITLNYTAAASDITKPLVNTTLPAERSIFNITNVIEIAVNVTDETAVSRVFANVTYPNGTINQLTLSNASAHNDTFNISFTIPELTGVYNITYIGNDSSNNINSSTTSNFTVNVGCAVINGDTTMNQNVSSERTCFTINASNIIVDCAGYWTTYGSSDTGYGVNNTGEWDNVTVKNCVLKKGSATGSNNYGIYFTGAVDGTIQNNSIYTNGTSDNYGVYLFSTVNRTVVVNNTIYTQGTSSFNVGIYLITTVYGNNITGNIIVTNGTTENYGIAMSESANNSLIYNNKINTTGVSGGTNYGIYLFNRVGGNNISSNTIYTNGSTSNVGVIFNTIVDHNVVADNTIYTQGTSTNYGIQLTTTVNDNNITGNTIVTNGTSSNHGIYLAISANYTFISMNNITARGTTSHNYGVYLSGSSNTTLLNNNISSTSFQDYDIFDDTGSNSPNFLIYNNSFGEIRWTNTTGTNGAASDFLENLTLNISNSDGIGLGRNLFIGNNTATLNTTAFTSGLTASPLINSTANITLYTLNNWSSLNGIKTLQNYSTDSSEIRSKGTNCTNCYISSFSSGTLRFNVSSFSSYAGDLVVANSLPTAPDLVSLINNATTTNRTSSFVWNNSTDPDGDAITYNIVIDDNPTFNNPEVNVTNIAPDAKENTTYAISTELNVDTTFYWKVAANDSTGYGAWSNASNFTVQSYLLISLSTSSVAFGAMVNNDTNDTTDGSPAPFTAVNSGNILANVTLTGTAYFSSVALPSSYYQFKIRANESNSFNAANTSFINMSSSYTGYHVVNLSWQDVNDDFLADILVTVPVGEPSGAKSSTITFTIEG